MRIQRYIRHCLLFLLPAAVVSSCGEMDDTYDEFLKGGEFVYTGKPDALQAFSGNKRIKLAWDLISDPKITKVKFYWNNPQNFGEAVPGERVFGKDSSEVAVDRSALTVHMEHVIDNLREGVYTFEVYTYDDKGHRSIRSEVIGEVFGDTYQNTVSNRLIDKAYFITSNGTGEIRWFGVSQQCSSIDITYTNNAGAEQTLIVTKVVTDPRKPAAFSDRTVLPNYKPGTTFHYRTGYVPNETAIDVFYSGDSGPVTPVNNLFSPGPYKVIARHSGKALGIVNAGTGNNAQVEQRTYGYDAAKTGSQIWMIAQNDAGYQVLTNLNGARDLGVLAGATTAGANIVQLDQSTATHDEWIIEPVTAGSYDYFRIKNRKSNLVIQIASSSTSDGALAQQQAQGTATSQQFQIISTGSQ